jgi:hypothetical protein
MLDEAELRRITVPGLNTDDRAVWADTKQYMTVSSVGVQHATQRLASSLLLSEARFPLHTL